MRWHQATPRQVAPQHSLLVFHLIGQVYASLHLLQQQQSREHMAQGLQLVERLYNQKPRDKNKLYSLHAPEVECISKGKSHKRYEFGVKSSLVTSLKTGLVPGARTYPGNPYDGHTLKDQLEQTSVLLEPLGIAPRSVYVDLGYRGQDIEAKLSHLTIVHRGKYSRLSKKQRRWLKRRQSIEPIIGHIKADHRLNKCHLKGVKGDAIHTLLCACGFNIKWLLNRAGQFKGYKPGTQFFCAIARYCQIKIALPFPAMLAGNYSYAA